jgi:hypothetical protein
LAPITRPVTPTRGIAAARSTEISVVAATTPDAVAVFRKSRLETLVSSAIVLSSRPWIRAMRRVQQDRNPRQIRGFRVGLPDFRHGG